MVSFDAVINSLEESVILFDKWSRIRYLNRAGEELFGRGVKDILGMKLDQLIKGEKTITPLLKKAVTEARSFRGKSISLIIGHPRNMDFILSPLYLHDRIEGSVLSLSENLHISTTDSDDSDSLYYLLGSIAHEIKNPLGGIKGAAQLLRNKTQNVCIDDYIDLIIRETDRLNMILHDYLVICKKPSFHQVNVHEVIEKGLTLMQAAITKGKVMIKRSYDPSLPHVRGDEAKLLQVFVNIIKNAIESMKKGGKLEISTSPSKELFGEQGKTKRMAVISVKDTGRGISEKEIEKIFVPFYTRKKSGTGIGLALSKRIIRDHGGLIRVNSQKGKGTTFFIYLPFES